jgi:hypothetical protein
MCPVDNAGGDVRVGLLQHVDEFAEYGKLARLILLNLNSSWNPWRSRTSRIARISYPDLRTLTAPTTKKRPPLALTLLSSMQMRAVG